MGIGSVCCLHLRHVTCLSALCCIVLYCMRGIRICISCSMPPPQQRDDRNHTDTGTPTVVVDAIHAHPRSDDRDDAPANARKILHREGDSERGVAAKEAIKC